MKKLTGVFAEVGQELKIIKINNEVEELQNLVQGYIEVVRMPNNILMIANEEGLFSKPKNFSTFSLQNGVVHPGQAIHGNVFFISYVGEEFVSLDKEQIQEVRRYFQHGRDKLIVK